MRRLAWMLVPLLLGLAACRPPKLSGESVGQYSVTGALMENTCGEGYPTPDTLGFYVELRHESGVVGYWKLADAPIVTGTVEREGAFRFVERREVVAIPADPMTGAPGCSLGHEETVEGTLLGALESMSDAALPDGGVAEPTPGEARFEGSTTISVTPSTGDCTPLLGTAGGPFPALPCTIRFELDAEQLEEPLW